MIVYNKLVRDLIPDIIKSSNKKCDFSVLEEKEFKLELKKKLVEEALELLNAGSEEESINELADIYEVLEHIIKINNYDKLKINKIKNDKAINKGKFNKKYFLRNVE